MNWLKEQFRKTSSVNGSYSVGMIAIMICVVIMVNVVASKLPENIKSIDVSDNKIYEISDVSKDFLKDLDQKIDITVYAEKASTDKRISTFLDKYEALSKNIKVKWVDPVQHPAELTENDVTENTVFVKCEDTGKSKAISFNSILVTDEYTYYTTGSTDPTEFDGEGQITSAINYVTSDNSSKVYYTSGHGETSFSTDVTDFFDKNNITSEELNLLMSEEIPEDCDLLIMAGVTTDITEAEEKQISAYMAKGGDVMVLLGAIETETPILNGLLETYGIERVDGYIADTERCYQGNYYYIFPNLSTTSNLLEGMNTGMVLLINAAGMNLTGEQDESITTSEFMSTSENGYAVTNDAQTQGTYVLGAVATQTINLEDDDSATEVESRLTVSSVCLIDSQVTGTASTLENLTLFGNAVTAGMSEVENLAIEAKSLSVTTNTMQYTGIVGFALIIGIPVLILVFGFRRWLRRRKA